MQVQDGHYQELAEVAETLLLIQEEAGKTSSIGNQHEESIIVDISRNDGVITNAIMLACYQVIGSGEDICRKSERIVDEVCK